MSTSRERTGWTPDNLPNWDDQAGVVRDTANVGHAAPVPGPAVDLGDEVSSMYARRNRLTEVIEFSAGSIQFATGDDGSDTNYVEEE